MQLFILLKQNNVHFNGLYTFNGLPFIINKGVLKIEENVVINSSYRNNPIGGNTFSSFWVKQGGRITISSGARISNTAFVSEKSIFVGRNVYIGGDCKIYDTDFHSVSLESRMQRPDLHVKSDEVIIGDGAFIGTGTIILKGVTIGEHAVIGAGSVVAKSIPTREIWAGNPAKFIKNLT